MRTGNDLSPLARSSIGFERVFDLLKDGDQPQLIDTWPPYNIVRTGEDSYRVTVAVAGFSEDDLAVTQEGNLLLVSGHKPESEHEYLHRGIVRGAFERRFELADYVNVTGARLENGLLTVDLKRELPEEMRPRRIAIGTGGTSQHPGQIEGETQAA